MGPRYGRLGACDGGGVKPGIVGGDPGTVVWGSVIEDERSFALCESKIASVNPTPASPRELRAGAVDVNRSRCVIRSQKHLLYSNSIFGTQDSNLKGAGTVTLAGPRWGRFDLTVSA